MAYSRLHQLLPDFEEFGLPPQPEFHDSNVPFNGAIVPSTKNGDYLHVHVQRCLKS